MYTGDSQSGPYLLSLLLCQSHTSLCRVYFSLVFLVPLDLLAIVPVILFVSVFLFSVLSHFFLFLIIIQLVLSFPTFVCHFFSLFPFADMIHFHCTCFLSSSLVSTAPTPLFLSPSPLSSYVRGGPGCENC